MLFTLRSWQMETTCKDLCVCVCGGQFAFPFYSVVNRDVTLHHLSPLPPEVECHRSTAVLWVIISFRSNPTMMQQWANMMDEGSIILWFCYLSTHPAAVGQRYFSFGVVFLSFLLSPKFPLVFCLLWCPCTADWINHVLSSTLHRVTLGRDFSYLGPQTVYKRWTDGIFFFR